MNEESTTPPVSLNALSGMAAFQSVSTDVDSIRAVHETAALVATPGWASISIRGKDAADYLHRRLAQSVKDLEIGFGRQALQLNGEGRMECDLLLYRRGESDFVALTEPGSAAFTVEILDKYVLMDEVEVAGEWESIQSLILLGPKASDLLEAVLGEALTGNRDRQDWHSSTGMIEDTRIEVYRDGRWHVPCFHLLVPQDRLSQVAERLAVELKEMNGALISGEAFNYARIENGVTLFGQDTTGKTLPLEVNLRPAIDLNKGCFPGQEFLARINNLGHPARVLARLRFDGTAEMAEADAVIPQNGDDAGGGAVTSVQTLEGLNEGLALATLLWKQRRLEAMTVKSKNGEVTVRVEVLGEYRDARSEAE